MYASHYDHEHKKFMTVELNDANKQTFEKDSTKETLVKFDSLQLATANTQIFNHNIEIGEFVISICKDCKKSFIITKKEADWFGERNYVLPVRCYPCRKKRKEEKAKTNQ
jgi:hypothetical protein